MVRSECEFPVWRPVRLLEATGFLLFLPLPGALARCRGSALCREQDA